MEDGRKNDAGRKPYTSCPASTGHLSPGLSITVSPLLQQEATPEDFANHIDNADWLIRTRGVTPGSDRASHSRDFLLAARFLEPEDAEAVEGLMEELGLEFMGAEPFEPPANEASK